MKPTVLTFDVLDHPTLDLHLTNAVKPVDAVPMMFPSWNAACRDEGGGVGLAKGWHVVIAGGTGAGKSIVALNCAAAAIQAGQAVCYLSLEMSQAQLITRLLAIATGAGVKYLERGKGFDRAIACGAADEFLALTDRTGGSVRVNKYPLRDLSDIDMVFGYFTDREPCTVFIVDYLQLAWAGSAKSMLESITEISHCVRSRAHEKGIVSIGLSQFNRQTSGNRGDKPRPEGLMGGSPLENDADQVLLLDHTAYQRTSANYASGKVLLAKNRHGPQVEIPVTFDYGNLQIREEAESGEAA